MRVAALTMSYNEPVWAGVWARHYASALGAEHCSIIDHGSDDDSTRDLPVRVRRLERSALSEAWRVAVVSEEVSCLLRQYDAVIYTDIDELLVADPQYHSGLRELAAAAVEPVLTAIGLDLQHIPDREPALDFTQPIGAQREWVRFSAALCKPVLVRRMVDWAPGFHCCDAPMTFDRLYLLHMRYADLGAGLRRLARTRTQAVVDPVGFEHQRVPDADFEGMMRAIGGLPREEGAIDQLSMPLLGWLERLRDSRVTRETQTYKLDLSLSGDVLWRLAPAMRGLIQY